MGQAQIRIFDTTLRDGEQAPGFSLRPAEKLLPRASAIRCVLPGEQACFGNVSGESMAPSQTLA